MTKNFWERLGQPKCDDRFIRVPKIQNAYNDRIIILYAIAYMHQPGETIRVFSVKTTMRFITTHRLACGSDEGDGQNWASVINIANGELVEK